MKCKISLILLMAMLPVLCDVMAHPTGFRRLSAQEREAILRDAIEFEPPKTRADLPSRVVNQNHLPRVWTQGALGICGSFSPTYYLRNYYESKRLGEGRWDYEKDADKMVSPTWSVIMVPHGDDSETEPWGANSLTTIQILCKRGYRTLAELPFSGNIQDWYIPTAEEQLDALHHKGGKPVVISNIASTAGLLKLKKALAAGEIFSASTQPIPISFDAYPLQGEDVEITQKNGKKITVNSTNNDVFVWPSSGKTRQGHAVTIIGYDDNMAYTAKDGTQKKGALLAVNSWGTNWGVSVNGEGGYIWFAYDSLLTHGFIDTEVYSMTIGDGDYVPTMTATLTFSCDGYPNGWKQLMMGQYGRFWPGGFDYKANGLEMDNPLWGINLYVKGIESDPNHVQALIDLSGFENIRLNQIDIYMGFGVNHNSVGKIIQADFRDKKGTLFRTVPIDEEVQAYSKNYPTFSTIIPTLYETADALPPLFPQSGSIQFGDLNGDGRLDAVSSVRQDNAIDEGIVNDQGITMFIENRHSVWLRQADGAWKESHLDVGGISDSAFELILVDLNADGVLDVAASNGQKTIFLQNDGKGKFTRLASIEHRNGEYEASGIPGYFATGDFDNDGHPDFVLINDSMTQIIRQESPTQYIVYPVSDKTFRAIQPVQLAHGLAVGDINGDGWMDFVVFCEEPSPSWASIDVLYINNRNMHFTPYELPLPHADFTSIAIADADQDGCDDILYCGGPKYDRDISDYRTTLRILRGRPNDEQGNVQLPVPLPIAADIPSRWGANAAWADVDLDGRLEAIMTGPEGKSPSNGYDPYGEDTIKSYPLHESGRNYLKVLSWDGEKYVDSHLELPGTAGFTGPSLMTIVDFDNDGKPDIVHGGLFYGRSEVFTGRQGPSRNVTGIKYVHNEVTATNAAPTAPTGLSAKDAKSGSAVFTWTDSTDAETASAGLRYFLRVGTTSGKDDVIAASNTFAHKSGVTLTNLPAKQLFWAVRAIDATGNLSPWSSEGTVTPSGTTPPPPMPTMEALPKMIELPDLEYNSVDCTSADESQGTASGGFGGYYKMGEFIDLYATPKSGYRFAYWEGPALEPLSCVSQAFYYGNEKFVAHFVPDTSFLQASAEATGYRDSSGNLWLWGAYNNINGRVEQNTPPQLAAAASTLYFALANDTAFYGKVGSGDAMDYYGENPSQSHWSNPWGYNHLLLSVDGRDWNNRETPTDKEHIEHAWGGPGGLAAIQPSKTGRSLTVIGGAETGNDSITVMESENFIQCAVQEGFVLMLTSSGIVKGIGDNDHCQIGATAPLIFTQYTEIKGLPLVIAIAAGASFGAALDTEGNVWTWGDNRKGQLGRGTVGASYPKPEKIAGLTAKIIAIAAGNNHLLALDANGTLHAWGDNTKGQLGAANGRPLAGKKVTAVAAAADRTVAIDSTGDLYAWGDGKATPSVLDNVNFTPVPFTLDFDKRYTHLLPMAAGAYAARTGKPITITANSDDESTFQYWTVNGEINKQNPLVITPSEPFTVKAFFASRPAIITLGEPEYDDTEISVPVIMSESTTSYDGLDFTIQFSASLMFSRLDFG
ncbi:MAG: VCBS repeat-containing protein, partial [Victivallales bacterium]|nr:VCBS repeat-containing protein [Victivallales bacterium]